MKHFELIYNLSIILLLQLIVFVIFMVPFLRINSVDKIVFRYFIRYFTTSFLLFISIFFLFSLLQIVNDKDIVKGLSIILIIKSVIYLIPSVITESLIFSSVFSSFFTVGEMSIKGEIIALRCSTYSYPEINSKIILIVILFIPILYHLNHHVVPSARFKSRQYIRTMINNSTNINLRDNTFERISSSYIITQEAKNSSLINVSIIRNSSKIIDSTKKADYIVNIKAETGVYTTIKNKGLLLSLNNGKISYINQNNPDIYYQGSFDSYITFIPFETNKKDYITNLKFLTTKELEEIYKVDTEQRYKIKKEIFTRTANSISLFSITLLALITAFLFEKESKYFSFIASIGIIFIYYVLEILSDNIVSKKMQDYPQIKFLPFVIIMISSFLIYQYGLKKK